MYAIGRRSYRDYHGNTSSIGLVDLVFISLFLLSDPTFTDSMLSLAIITVYGPRGSSGAGLSAGFDIAFSLRILLQTATMAFSVSMLVFQDI